MIKHSDEFVSAASYIYLNSLVKLVVGVKEASRFAVLHMNGKIYAEAYNYKEPLDLVTHVFFVPQSEFRCGEAEIHFKRYKTEKTEWFPEGEKDGACSFVLNESDIREYADCVSDMDSGIELPEYPTEQEILDGKVIYSRYDTNNKYGEPVVFFTLEIDPEYATFITGTPNDGYISGGVKQTVKDEAREAIKNGKNVVAATNADFFDIFGTLRPAGLCIKNCVIVDNSDSDRPFLGVTKDVSFVITDLKESPQMLVECENAVSGGQIVMKNGDLAEVCPLEPFGYIKHPRTAAGITPEGKLIILVVDGRISEYSNGATLVDIASLLKRLGANTAINLDGGGSSTVIVKNNSGEFDVRNIPADLYRPYDRLIRDLYDSILIITK